MNSGIYKITDLRNNKIYIGQAVNLANRKWRHWCFLHPDRYSINSLSTEFNMAIHCAMMESGNDNDFSFEVLEYCNRDLLNEKEQYYIKLYNSLMPNGYNQTSGGNCYPHLKGEQCVNHKITQNEADQIKYYLKQGWSAKQIQEIIPNATIGIISAINTGRNWVSDSEQYPLSKLNGVKILSDDEVRYIREQRSLGVSTVDLAQQFHTSTSQISSITNGKTRKDAGGEITKQFKFSEEQVYIFRSIYQIMSSSMKDLWRHSGFADKVSYDAFCDMLQGKTYTEYPILQRQEEYKPQNTQMKLDRYKQIQELYATKKYTKKEIAKIIGCSERTVYRALNYV